MYQPNNGNLNSQEDFPSFGGADQNQQQQNQQQQNFTQQYYQQQQPQYYQQQQQMLQPQNQQQFQYQQNYGQQQQYVQQQQYGNQQQQYDQSQVQQQQMLMQGYQQQQFQQPQQNFGNMQTSQNTNQMLQMNEPQSQDAQATTTTQQAAATTDASASSSFNTGATAFQVTASPFTPGGVKQPQNEDSFSLADLASQQQTKKQQQNTLLKKQQEEKEKEKLAQPTKGKDSQFFVVTDIDEATQKPKANNEQMLFVFEHYPEYGLNPVDILNWLYTQALTEEQRVAAYRAPKQRVQQVVEDEESEEEESGFGQSQAHKLNAKKKGKGGMQVQQTDIKKKPIKVKDPEKEAKAEEVKKSKVVKDIVIREEDDQDIVDVDESRQPCSLIFIGHVDAGKSTICGNLMQLMGIVDQRTIAKYKQEAKDKGRDSWWLAYVMDSTDEEKNKGKTVEVGRANFDTKSKNFTVFDAPGHKNYVPNMIMGAALADFAGLVISARKGEFEAGFEKDGQTREHAQLAKSLGVQKLIVIVNKMDDCKWDKSRWTEIQEGLTPFLTATGYDVKNDVLWVPISGLTGANILEPAGDTCKWYEGPTLVELLDNIPLLERDPNGPLRIPVLDKLKERGIVAHGKVESGTVRLGDKLTLSPNEAPCQVLNLYNGKNQSVRYARPGENVQLRLLHIEDEERINKGDVLCMRDSPMPVTQLFEAEIEVLELLEYKPILSRGYTCIMHIHTFADDCTIKDIIVAHEKQNDGSIVTKDNPKFTRSFAKIRARVSVRLPLPMEKVDVIDQLGRFTLRDEGKTIAIGKIIRYKPNKPGNAPTKGTSAQVAEVTNKLDNAKISEQKAKTQDMVFDMESGEMKAADAKPEAIAEGENEDDY